MNVVPGPGLSSHPGIAPPEKGIQPLKSGISALIFGNKLLDLCFDYGINGGLFIQSQLASLSQEFIIDF